MPNILAPIVWYWRELAVFAGTVHARLGGEVVPRTQMKRCLGICVIVLCLFLVVPSLSANQLTISESGSQAMGLRGYQPYSDLTGWSNGVIEFSNQFGDRNNDLSRALLGRLIAEKMELRDSDWRFFKHQDHQSRWNWDNRKKKHTAVPEPGSFLMLVAGLGFVTGAARRKLQ